MPTIHRIGKVKIQVFGDDHAPPHFHVWRPEGQALVAIETLDVLASEVPERLLQEAMDWAASNKPTLREAWDRLNGARKR